MKWVIMLAVPFLASNGTAQTTAQTAQRDAPTTVERLCRKLEHVQEIPVKTAQNTFVTEARKLPRVAVSLYPAEEGRECCSGASPIASTATGRWGSFRFNEKKLTSGLYWIVVKPSGREYRLLIQYAQKKNSDRLCSDTFWQVTEDGNFWKTETVFVQ
jgi:hypothetical protein